MEQIHVKRMLNNMAIICKLLNSVAKQCGCKVAYDHQSGNLQFSGDPSYRKFIVEETLSYFRAG